MRHNLSIDNLEVGWTSQSEQRRMSGPSDVSNETNYGDERTFVDLKEEKMQNEDRTYMSIFRSSDAVEEVHVTDYDPVYKNSKPSAVFSLPLNNDWDASVSTGNRPQWDTVKLKNTVVDKQLDSGGKYTKEPLAVSSRLKPRTMKKKALIPSVAPEFRERMELLQINVLTIFNNTSNSIVVSILPKTGDQEKDCMNYMRETFGMLYTEMKKLPNLTFVEHPTELNFKGSYCYDYGVCSFDAQLWKVDPSIAKGNNKDREYIIQFRRKSLKGRDAFDHLLRRIAAFLLEWGRAKKYANGFNIYPYKNTSMELDVDSCDEILFDSPTQSPIEISSDSDIGCQITLDSDLICSWAKTITEMWAYGEENIRILAMSSKNIDNCELMAEEPKLHKALCVELKKGRNPSSCANTLVIIEAILKWHSIICVDSLREHGILDAVTRSLLSYNCYEPKLSLGSLVIERASLKILEMLITNQKNSFSKTEMEMVLIELEKLEGKLTDRSSKCLNKVIIELKKRTCK